MSQHPDVPAEQARNTEYLQRLAARPVPAGGLGIARSRRWVDPASIKGAGKVGPHPLIGRIGFDAADEFLGRACYIGPARMDEAEIQVINWDADLAKRLFFGNQDAGGVIDGELVVRRTFDHRIDDIADLDDEWIRPVDPSPFAAELRVPRPAPGQRGRRRRPPAESGLPAERAPKDPPAHPVDATTEIRTDAVPIQVQVPTDGEVGRLAGMRAAATVVKKLAAPRSDSLKSVLATLQPDQFEVVSAAPDEDLMVQGHPGTGKTVVAAYRAAFLVGEGRKELRAGSVLLVGPTPEYVAHVRELLRPLDPDGRVVVTDIARVLSATVDLKSPWSGGIGGDHDDIDARARRFADQAERLLRHTERPVSGPNARREHIKAIYALVRSNGLPGQLLSEDPADGAWMRGLPAFDQAVRLRRYLPLLTQITLAFQPVPHTDQFGHVLVDEAQDISPIEWNVLDQHLRPRGRWTLVGDMNQRRSDTTYSSWDQISDHLGIGSGDAPLPPVVLRRGYRSTTPILKFADKLLPAKQRGATSIQNHGPLPKPRHVRTVGQLTTEAIGEAQRLCRAYPDGTVAIITVDPGPLLQSLGKAGWRRGSSLNVWTRDDQTVRVFVPESARGLEFDAVVVVEPGAFPETLGRDGQLYTSLTRANRELAVLWHRDLPDALRKTGRRD